MIKKITIILFLFIYIILYNPNYVCGKYTIEKNLEVANINLDRTKPKLIYLDINNITVYMTPQGRKYDVSFGMKIQEKNLLKDEIRRDKIKTWVENVEKPVNIKMTEIKHSKEEHIFNIEVTGVTGTGYLKIEFLPGAVTDKAGWQNSQNTVDLKLAIDSIEITKK